MTERTYTETEVQAIRAATLREAAEKLVERAKQYQDEPDAWQALHVEAAYILAMIDQPDADALNAMIGAAYLDAASSLDERGSDGWAEHMAAEFAAVQGEAIRELTPADALAALERVKQETLAQATTSVMIERMAKEIYAAMRFDREEEAPEWVDGGNSFAQDAARDAAKRIAAAIRGESDE